MKTTPDIKHRIEFLKTRIADNEREAGFVNLEIARASRKGDKTREAAANRNLQKIRFTLWLDRAELKEYER